MKRIITILSIALVSLGSLSNCFGKFGLTKTVYGINAGITIGSGKIAKLIRTILMYIPFSFAYWIATFLDLILFNLVEFWTDSNPIAMSEYNMDGTLVKEYNDGNENVRLTYSKFGKELKVEAISKTGNATFYAFANQPGKLFKSENNEMIELKETEGPVPFMSVTPY